MSKKTADWKVQQKRKKMRIFMVRFIRIFFSIAGLVAFVGLINFLRFLQEPLAEYIAFGEERSVQIWEGKDQLVVGAWLLENESERFRNGVFIVKPEKNKIGFFLLPKEISLENVQELSSYTAMPIDRYIVITQQFSEEPVLIGIEKALSDAENNMKGFSGYAYLAGLFSQWPTGVYTDITPRDLVHFKQTFAYIENLTVGEWPDINSAVLYDAFKTDFLQEDAILSSGATVWVRNMTDIPGLATTISRYAENLGFDIVRIDNVRCPSVSVPCEASSTKIYINQSQKYTRGINRLESIIGVTPESTDDEIIKRADVVVFVGTNVQELMYLP